MEQQFHGYVKARNKQLLPGQQQSRCQKPPSQLLLQALPEPDKSFRVLLRKAYACFPSSDSYKF